MKPSELSDTELRTHLLTNGGQRAAIARDVSSGKSSAERERPKLRKLVEQAEQLRKEAYRRNLFPTGRRKVTVPEWLDKE